MVISPTARFAGVAFALGGCAAVADRPPPPPPVVHVAPERRAVIGPPPSAHGVGDGVAAVRLIRALYDGAERDDDDFVRAHALLPLRGHEITSRVGQAPQVGAVGALDDIESLKHRAMCEHPPAEGSALQEFTVDDTQARGFLTLDGHRYRLTFEPDPPRLVEQSYVVADAAVPARAPMDRPFHIDVEPRSDHGSLDRRLADRVRGYLMTHPHCIEAQARRQPIGLSMLVTVETRPSLPPEVSLYASTVGPVAYLGCLQAQLRPTLSQIVAAESEPRLHELWVMVGIVVYDHEVPDDVSTLRMMGPGT